MSIKSSTFLVVVAAFAAPGCLSALGLHGGVDLPSALLRPEPYHRILVDVDHAPGVAPCAGTVELFLQVLESVTRKTVILDGPDRIAPGDGQYSNRDLSRLHRQSADGATREGTVFLHVVYLNGAPTMDGEARSAGRTLHGEGALFVFKDSFSDAHRMVGPARQDATCDVERAVILHELGHVLGLVNRGIPMTVDRESDDHAGHSTNPGSVMFPTLHLASGGLILREPPRNFDAHDYEDLRAFRLA